MKSPLSHPHLLLSLTVAVAVFIFMSPPLATAAPAPLRVLLITGGCCHDYAKQKDILKKGIEERAFATVDIVYATENIDGKATKPKLPIYGNPDYAKGYDVVIHDECAADISDLATIDAVIKPHKD